MVLVEVEEMLDNMLSELTEEEVLVSVLRVGC
jgi:hypothetical protein